jgi:folate-dependent phosphoribosylglycinamide formyltransferase PurN
MKRLFAPHTAAAPARAVVFLSGGGSNAEAILEYSRSRRCAFQVVALATDAPRSSRTGELGGRYGVPTVALDLREFYRERGEETIRLDSPHRRALRQEWSDALYARLAPFAPELGLLAGFMPLTNLTGKIPCLNVHPGDLTLEDASGNRLLAGLHILPVERAILAGHAALRSSVILAQPYSGDGAKEMDSGPVLGVSAPMPLDLKGATPEELRALREARTPGRLPDDELRRLALSSIERLKVAGDHVVLPRAADDFAAGRFYAEGKRLGFLNDAGNIECALTVEYRADGSRQCLENTR